MLKKIVGEDDYYGFRPGQLVRDITNGETVTVGTWEAFLNTYGDTYTKEYALRQGWLPFYRSSNPERTSGNPHTQYRAA